MILGRPELSKELGGKRFSEFFYSEEELMDFCKKNGLSVEGSKNELTERIKYFLDSGKELTSRFIPVEEIDDSIITMNSVIEQDFQYEQKHKIFFQAELGAEFVMNDDFEDWLYAHPGRTYKEALDVWVFFQET